MFLACIAAPAKKYHSIHTLCNSTLQASCITCPKIYLFCLKFIAIVFICRDWGCWGRRRRAAQRRVPNVCSNSHGSDRKKRETLNKWKSGRLKRANVKLLALFSYSADNLFNRFENQQQCGKRAKCRVYDYDGVENGCWSRGCIHCTDRWQHKAGIYCMQTADQFGVFACCCIGLVAFKPGAWFVFIF